MAARSFDVKKSAPSTEIELLENKLIRLREKWRLTAEDKPISPSSKKLTYRQCVELFEIENKLYNNYAQVGHPHQYKILILVKNNLQQLVDGLDNADNDAQSMGFLDEIQRIDVILENQSKLEEKKSSLKVSPIAPPSELKQSSAVVGESKEASRSGISSPPADGRILTLSFLEFYDELVEEIIDGFDPVQPNFCEKFLSVSAHLYALINSEHCSKPALYDIKSLSKCCLYSNSQKNWSLLDGQADTYIILLRRHSEKNVPYYTSHLELAFAFNIKAKMELGQISEAENLKQLALSLGISNDNLNQAKGSEFNFLPLVSGIRPTQLSAEHCPDLALPLDGIDFNHFYRVLFSQDNKGSDPLPLERISFHTAPNKQLKRGAFSLLQMYEILNTSAEVKPVLKLYTQFAEEYPKNYYSEMYHAYAQFKLGNFLKAKEVLDLMFETFKESLILDALYLNALLNYKLGLHVEGTRSFVLAATLENQSRSYPGRGFNMRIKDEAFTFYCAKPDDLKFTADAAPADMRTTLLSTLKKSRDEKPLGVIELLKNEVRDVLDEKSTRAQDLPIIRKINPQILFSLGLARVAADDIEHGINDIEVAIFQLNQRMFFNLQYAVLLNSTFVKLAEYYWISSLIGVEASKLDSKYNEYHAKKFSEYKHVLKSIVANCPSSILVRQKCHEIINSLKKGLLQNSVKQFQLLLTHFSIFNLSKEDYEIVMRVSEFIYNAAIHHLGIKASAPPPPPLMPDTVSVVAPDVAPATDCVSTELAPVSASVVSHEVPVLAPVTDLTQVSEPGRSSPAKSAGNKNNKKSKPSSTTQLVSDDKKLVTVSEEESTQIIQSLSQTESPVALAALDQESKRAIKLDFQSDIVTPTPLIERKSNQHEKLLQKQQAALEEQARLVEQIRLKRIEAKKARKLTKLKLKEEEEVRRKAEMERRVLDAPGLVKQRFYTLSMDLDKGGVVLPSRALSVEAKYVEDNTAKKRQGALNLHLFAEKKIQLLKILEENLIFESDSPEEKSKITLLNAIRSLPETIVLPEIKNSPYNLADLMGRLESVEGVETVLLVGGLPRDSVLGIPLEHAKRKWYGGIKSELDIDLVAGLSLDSKIALEQMKKAYPAPDFKVEQNEANPEIFTVFASGRKLFEVHNSKYLSTDARAKSAYKDMLIADSEQRDFYLNTIYTNRAGRLGSPFYFTLFALIAKVIHPVNKNFLQDPRRLLRGIVSLVTLGRNKSSAIKNCEFKSMQKYDFELSSEFKEILKANKALLVPEVPEGKLTPEQEMQISMMNHFISKKVIASPESNDIFMLFNDLGITDILFPELKLTDKQFENILNQSNEIEHAYLSFVLHQNKDDFATFCEENSELPKDEFLALLRQEIFKLTVGQILFQDCFNNHHKKIAKTTHRKVLSLEEIFLDKIYCYGKELGIVAPVFEFHPQEEDEARNPFIAHPAFTSSSNFFEHKGAAPKTNSYSIATAQRPVRSIGAAVDASSAQAELPKDRAVPIPHDLVAGLKKV